MSLTTIAIPILYRITNFFLLCSQVIICRYADVIFPSKDLYFHTRRCAELDIENKQNCISENLFVITVYIGIVSLKSFFIFLYELWTAAYVSGCIWSLLYDSRYCRCRHPNNITVSISTLQVEIGFSPQFILISLYLNQHKDTTYSYTYNK